MSEEKIFITPQDAINVLPSREIIHTFYNGVWGLLGADWSKEDVILKINSVDFIEITGEQAQAMKHGLALYNKGDTQSDVLFVETDMNKLAELEKKKREVSE